MEVEGAVTWSSKIQYFFAFYSGGWPSMFLFFLPESEVISRNHWPSTASGQKEEQRAICCLYGRNSGVINTFAYTYAQLMHIFLMKDYISQHTLLPYIQVRHSWVDCYYKWYWWFVYWAMWSDFLYMLLSISLPELQGEGG